MYTVLYMYMYIFRFTIFLCDKMLATTTSFLFQLIPNRIITADISSFDLTGLLWLDTLFAANLPKEENARKRFLAPFLP